MITQTTVSTLAVPRDGLPAGMTLLLAASCGLIAANIYYPQPLIGQIGATLGLSPATAGLIVMMTQLGYGLGLLLIVPLGDLLENRRLLTVILALAILSLTAAASTGDVVLFLAAALLIGLGSVAVQMLLLYASHLASPEQQGKAVGVVASGLMLGIMLARPVAGLVAGLTHWRVVFMGAAGLMLILANVLHRALPVRHPMQKSSYLDLLRSMPPLLRHYAELRWRAFYQACLFAAFSLFWTTVPMWMSDRFGFSATAIAVFSLTGLASVLVAPLAGQAADRGWDRAATGVAIVATGLCFVLTGWTPASTASAVTMLVLGSVLLGAGVTLHAVLGQRAVFALDVQARGRLNGLFIALYFTGGALGSILGSTAYAHGGWPFASGVGLVLCMLALAGLLMRVRMR